MNMRGQVIPKYQTMTLHVFHEILDMILQMNFKQVASSLPNRNSQNVKLCKANRNLDAA